MNSNGGDENGTGGLAREGYEKQEWAEPGGSSGTGVTGFGWLRDDPVRNKRYT